MDFSAIERAGLTQVEFAKLVNVTRVTVNHWVNGGTPANFLRRVVAAYLGDLEVAVQRGILPQALADLPPSLGESERRWEVIDEALTRVVVERSDA
jgi:transcriptional regulator with XRE-family HTH domain